MLLKSSLFLLLLSNIFINNLKFMCGISVILLVLNIVLNKELKNNLNRMKFLFFLYFSTCLIQLFYKQEGRVLFKIANFYITEEGMFNFLLNFLRIFNLLMISWIVSAKKIVSGKFNKYQKVIETVIDLVPQALVLIKKRMRIKWFFRHILKQIKVKI
ncbi:CbiQ family ECF transporter T component [uncultured Fusobacterium sp.]|jgi:energy-coupling factor transporter transmembrane protein EcfT|uniref:CbiQ family ECF transporter T component n=1 Tax=uncultured Fusobacterium sp. TaxID=159267 RepID=UPI0015A714AB|nr:CbiQ family ECF transporter T component [uncultured Fusobacterium sp.]